MHLAKSSWQSLHGWIGVLVQPEMQPALLGGTEPLGEGILKHSRLCFPASHRCCKPSKDTGSKQKSVYCKRL